MCLISNSIPSAPTLICRTNLPLPCPFEPASLLEVASTPLPTRAPRPILAARRRQIPACSTPARSVFPLHCHCHRRIPTSAFPVLRASTPSSSAPALLVLSAFARRSGRGAEGFDGGKFVAGWALARDARYGRRTYLLRMDNYSVSREWLELGCEGVKPR